MLRHGVCPLCDEATDIRIKFPENSIQEIISCKHCGYGLGKSYLPSDRKSKENTHKTQLEVILDMVERLSPDVAIKLWYDLEKLHPTQRIKIGELKCELIQDCIEDRTVIICLPHLGLTEKKEIIKKALRDRFKIERDKDGKILIKYFVYWSAKSDSDKKEFNGDFDQNPFIVKAVDLDSAVEAAREILPHQTTEYISGTVDRHIIRLVDEEGKIFLPKKS